MAIRTDAVGDSLTLSSGLPTSTSLSVCAWVKLTTDRNNYQSFFHFYYSGFGSQDVFLSTDSDGTTLNLFDGGAAVAGVNMTVGVPYWIGFTRTNTTRSLFYAALTDSTPTVATDATTQTITATLTTLYSMNDFYSEWVDGTIAAAKIWNGAALSQSQMFAERWSILPRTLGGLYDFWPMFPGTSERLRGYYAAHNWTAGGTLADEASPPVPFGYWLRGGGPVAAATPGVSIPVIMHHLRQQGIS